jgi:pimeloyl-ACP methyl ester carboxylesterase
VQNLLSFDVEATKGKPVFGRIVLIALAALVGCVLILVVVLLAVSPGKPKPAAAGGLSEKIWIPINGVRQGMFLQSKDTTRPVLLFLHGGPGMPTYFLNRRYPTGLEDLFTVCWWEQRGAGLSYHPDIPPETMTLEQLIADTIEVTNYLRRRFGKEKIYLLGHSWGSYLGIQAAARAPELYHAYIGMAQMVWQIRSENAAYKYMLAQYRERGDRGMVRRMEKAPISMNGPLPVAYLKLRDPLMHGLGVGTTHDMKSVITGIFFPVMGFPEYRFREKINIWRGKAFSRSHLWDPMLMTNLAAKVPELKLPVYFCHGVYDYTITYNETREYFEKLPAPLKGFYTFEHSAHSPAYEEPQRMRQILREDVLAGTNRLADAR